MSKFTLRGLNGRYEFDLERSKSFPLHLVISCWIDFHFKESSLPKESIIACGILDLDNQIMKKKRINESVKAEKQAQQALRYIAYCLSLKKRDLSRNAFIKNFIARKKFALDTNQKAD